MDFVIDRSKWRCGGHERDPYDGALNPSVRGIGNTQLLNCEGFMCCLGQVAVQLGADRSRIACAGIPEEADSESLEYLTPVLVSDECLDSPLSNAAMRINDDRLLSDEDRECALTELFAKHGHTLTFTGEYVKPDCVAKMPGEE